MILTDRLRLRRFRLDDAPALARYRSDPEVARFQSWRSPIDPAQAAAIVAGYRAESPEGPGFFQWAIELREHPGLIGDLAVGTVAARGGGLWALLGITVAPEYQRRGYAGEAMGAVAAHLRARGVRRVAAECDVRNTASARMLRRAGFRETGRASRFVGQRGRRAEFLLFGMPAEEACRAVRGAAQMEEEEMVDPGRVSPRVAPAGDVAEDAAGNVAQQPAQPEQPQEADGFGEGEA
ncbi:GNAT family N-acetyltransferase [Kitasatospora sp. NPDC059722]|uniref:GNAT family N-acetyltransferase n=1 Tax=Kitasatospora sp. NPDC059722 TaxID=3346925 RepID=UPI00368E0F2F